MLINFSVSNFRSFKEEALLNLSPAKRIKEKKEHILRSKKHKSIEGLPVSVMYGKNGSGKTTMIQALHFMKTRISVGKNLEEAYAMIEDTKVAWLQSCLEDGCTVPLPEEETAKMNSGKFMVRLSPKLHRELSTIAEKYGVSLSLRFSPETTG